MSTSSGQHTRIQVLSRAVAYRAERILCHRRLSADYIRDGLHVVYVHVTLVHWPQTLYEGFYEEARRHAESEDEADHFAGDWATFVTRCQARYKAFLAGCTMYLT